jgi:hypothetical protein
MMTGIELVILALAAFRLTTLIVTDSILDRPRNWLHRHFPVTDTWLDYKPKRGKARLVHASEQRWYVDEGTFLGDLTSCFFCFGVWASVSLGLLWHYVPVTHFGISLAAVTGLQLILSQWSNRASS